MATGVFLGGREEPTCIPSRLTSLPPFQCIFYLVRRDGREKVVLDLDVDPCRDDGPEPGVDTEVGGRLDLTHTPRGRLGGRLHTPRRKMVRLQGGDKEEKEVALALAEHHNMSI